MLNFKFLSNISLNIVNYAVIMVKLYWVSHISQLFAGKLKQCIKQQLGLCFKIVNYLFIISLFLLNFKFPINISLNITNYRFTPSLFFLNFKFLNNILLTIENHCFIIALFMTFQYEFNFKQIRLLFFSTILNILRKKNKMNNIRGFSKYLRTI